MHWARERMSIQAGTPPDDRERSLTVYRLDAVPIKQLRNVEIVLLTNHPRLRLLVF